MLAGVGAPTPHGVLQFLVETPFAAWGFVPVASGFFHVRGAILVSGVVDQAAVDGEIHDHLPRGREGLPA